VRKCDGKLWAMVEVTEAVIFKKGRRRLRASGRMVEMRDAQQGYEV